MTTNVSFADTLWLVNGDVITGEIQEINTTTLTIKPGYSSAIVIEKNAIKSFSSDALRTWKFNTTEKIAKAEESNTSHNIVVNGENFSIDAITLTPVTDKSGWQVTGHLDTSLDVDRDDKNTEKLHLNTDVTFESKTWRHNLKSEIKHEEENSNKTEDNGELTYSLDYFISTHWLVRNEVFYREDKLNDRSQYKYIQFGPGYRLWGEDKDKLDFIASYTRVWLNDKNVSLQLNAWALGVDYSQTWFNEKLETYANFRNIYPNWDTIDYILNSTVGLRYFLTSKIYVSAKYDIDKNKTILGTDSDHSYTIGAGVNF